MKPVSNRLIYGQMPERINAVVANALDKKEVQPVKRKSFAAILIAAALILALACTALAMSLNLSAQHTAIQEASGLVMDQYGFTRETLGLFMAEADGGKSGGWTVYFRPIKYGDRLGTYTVKLPEGEEATVRWSYDGINTQGVASGSLDSSIWGHKQIEQVLALDEAYMIKLRTLLEKNDNMAFWTMEERAELDQMLLDAGYWQSYRNINVLPTEDDLTEANAIALAEKAVQEKYGVTKESLSERTLFIGFYQEGERADKYYTIHWAIDPALDYTKDPNDFHVSVSSPTGDINMCYWSVMPEQFRLPEGSLAGYEQAIQEFTSMNVFDTLTHEERADVAERIQKAGYGSYLNGTMYTSPATSAVAEADALEIAGEALEEAYGLTEPMWSLFGVKTAHVREAGKPIWRVTLAYEWTDFFRPYEYYERLGEYTVLVDAETGAALETTWSLEGLDDHKTYTAQTWAQSPAWNADILQYTLAFDEALAAFSKTYDADEEWSQSVLAERDQMHRDAGFDPASYSTSLPGEGDLTQDEAEALLFEAIRREYGLTDADLATYRVVSRFTVADPDQPLWYFSLYATSMGKEDFYNATLAARTGEILLLEYIAQGNG